MSTEISLLTQTDLQNAGSVLHEATIYLNKYKSKHLELIELAKTAGEKLPKDVDDKLMAWQVSAKKAVKYIEEKRKPFTEKAHAFIKAFTAVENEIGAKLYNEIQNIRDKSAAIHAREAAEAKAKEQAELIAKQKRIDTIAAMSAQLRAGYASFLEKTKETLLSIYANVDLQSYDEAMQALQKFTNATFPRVEWDNITLNGPAELIPEVKTEEKLLACQNHYSSEVAKYANYIIGLMPARKAELERGEADNKQAEELAKKAQEEAEAAKLAAEKQAKEEAEKAKQQAMVANMVAEANREVEAPKAIESYSITISSIDGWRSVIEYFLSNSGTPVEDLGKIRLDQMKAFAEKQAKASGEMIEHKDINYDAKYKAVARATKKKVA